MKILLVQLDGKIPNIALMRVAHHHRAFGNDVDFRWGHKAAQGDLYDKPDRVYASLIFKRTRPHAEQLLRTYPDALVGGTGWDLETTLESVGITTLEQDYSIYPGWTSSIGYTQRGCRKKCTFCVVPQKEGAVRGEKAIDQIWRGDPYPRHLLLLDNDPFGHPEWRERIKEIRDGGFKVSFNQGINARFLTPETAQAIASVDYRDWQMKRKRIYTAWDNLGDEKILIRGLQHLVDAGIARRHIMVYMLIGYYPIKIKYEETLALILDLEGKRNPDSLIAEDEKRLLSLYRVAAKLKIKADDEQRNAGKDWEHRRRTLREFDCDIYPMPYIRTKETIGFQRWVVGAYDKAIPWADWVASGYRPDKLGRQGDPAQRNIL